MKLLSRSLEIRCQHVATVVGELLISELDGVFAFHLELQGAISHAIEPFPVHHMERFL